MQENLPEEDMVRNLITIGHIVSLIQNAPAAIAGKNAGVNPPEPILASCTDISGKVTFGTGTTPDAGVQVVVTFHAAFENAPAVVLTPINRESAILKFHAASTATTFTVSCLGTPEANQDNATYGFFYHVIGN